MQSDEEIIQQLEDPDIDDIIIQTFDVTPIEYDTIIYRKSTHKYYFIRLHSFYCNTIKYATNSKPFKERVINEVTVNVCPTYKRKWNMNTNKFESIVGYTTTTAQICMYDHREINIRNLHCDLYIFISNFIAHEYNHKIIADWFNEIHDTNELIFK